MQIGRRGYRWWCCFSVMGVVFLLSLFIGENACSASSHKIEKMAYADLNQLMTSEDGTSLLFFTAAWCGYCKAMLPILNRLVHRFRDSGLRFIGVSIDAGGPGDMERVLEKKPVNFSVFWVGETVVDELNLVGIPMIFMIKNGRMVDKIPGKCSYEFLEKRIADFIQ
jgi:thiol-disulfide isomerase/thioredoxin